MQKKTIVIPLLIIALGLGYSYYTSMQSENIRSEESTKLSAKKNPRGKFNKRNAAKDDAKNPGSKQSPDDQDEDIVQQDPPTGGDQSVTDEDRFVNELLSRKPMQTSSYQEANEQYFVKATLVDNRSRDKSVYIVRELFEDPNHQIPKYRTVQIANNLLVSFKEDLKPADRDRFLKEHNIRIEYSYSLPNTHLIQWEDISLEKMREIVSALGREEGVKYADPNYMAFMTKFPADPDAKTKAWHIINNGKNPKSNQAFVQGDDTHVEQTWDKITDCSKTIVAIIDSGVDTGHPDLKDHIMMDLGRSFHPDHVNDFNDTNGHGTHVAGIIGAIGENNRGSSGMCWKAKIIPIRVFPTTGGASRDIIVRGVLYAADSSAKVINMSLGGKGELGKVYEDAFKRGTSTGKLFFVAAGNDNLNIDSSPVAPASSTDPGVITVASYQGDGKMSGFSNYGATQVDIAAPGSDIWATFPTSKGSYAYLSGTSMATPVAAGAAALLWSYAPSLTSTELRAAILENSDVGNGFEAGKPIVGRRKLNVTKVLNAFAPKAEMTNLKADQLVKLEGSDQFEVAVGLTQKYSKVAKVEVLQGDQVLGTSMTMVDKIPITLPTASNTAAIRVRITDKDGHVTEGAPLSVKVAMSKSLKFSSIKIDEFLGDVKCTLAQTSTEGTATTLYEASVVSDGFCKRLCGIILPLAESTSDKISCESSAKAETTVPEVK